MCIRDRFQGPRRGTPIRGPHQLLAPSPSIRPLSPPLQMSAGATLKAVSFSTEDVLMAGDVAVETGTYSMTIEPKGGAAMEDMGRYRSVWKRQSDGSCKIERDISNTNIATAPSK